MQTPTHPNANQLRWPIVNAIHITNTVDWSGLDWIGLDWLASGATALCCMCR
jgi:hypothetical protein